MKYSVEIEDNGKIVQRIDDCIIQDNHLNSLMQFEDTKMGLELLHKIKQIPKNFNVEFDDDLDTSILYGFLRKTLNDYLLKMEQEPYEAGIINVIGE